MFALSRKRKRSQRTDFEHSSGFERLVSKATASILSNPVYTLQLARDIARRSFHRLSYTQTKVLRESKPNCPPTRAAEIRSSTQPLPFAPSLSRPLDPSSPLAITSHVDRSKTTFRWQSKTGELALVPCPGEDVPRSPTRAHQEAHADAILRKGARARERVAALRTELELREREACTFQPALVASPRKVRAARNRRTSVRKVRPDDPKGRKSVRKTATRQGRAYHL